MVREELGAVLLSVPQVIFLSGRQVIGYPRVEDGHAPSHADADESVSYRRFVSHVVSIAHIFSILWTLHDQAHAVDHVLVPSRDLLLLLLVPPIPQLLVEALRVHVDVRALRGRVEVLHQHVLARIGGVEEGLSVSSRPRCRPPGTWRWSRGWSRAPRAAQVRTPRTPTARTPG